METPPCEQTYTAENIVLPQTNRKNTLSDLQQVKTCKGNCSWQVLVLTELVTNGELLWPRCEIRWCHINTPLPDHYKNECGN